MGCLGRIGTFRIRKIVIQIVSTVAEVMAITGTHYMLVGIIAAHTREMLAAVGQVAFIHVEICVAAFTVVVIAYTFGMYRVVFAQRPSAPFTSVMLITIAVSVSTIPADGMVQVIRDAVVMLHAFTG